MVPLAQARYSRAMDPVSNANRIAQILRQRLLERARGRPSTPAPGAQTGRVDPLRELARAEGTPDRLLKRALVQSILDDPETGTHTLYR